MPVQDNFCLAVHFWLHTFIGFLLVSVVVSKIPLGSKLSVGDNNVWVSANGDFALGFFNNSGSSDQPSQYSVGIWFSSKSIPEDKRAVVWVAGADITVGDTSYFQLTEIGELVLFDSAKGLIAWSSKTGQNSVSSAVLHDDGNLILMNEKEGILWKSYDYPSNTLLPGQKLSVFQTLRAARVNSVSSYYSLYMNSWGELQLRWESNIIYWRSGTPHSNRSAIFTADGALQLQDRNLKPALSLYGDDHGEKDVKFRFLKLDTDGNLRMYSWSEASVSWRSVWQAVVNQCDVFATCGEHGICAINASGSAVCQCPFNNRTFSNSKCLVPYQQGCKSGSIMLAYNHTFLQGMYPPNDTVISANFKKCKQLCSNDPACTSVTFVNDGTAQCHMKTTQYITGYTGASISSISFVKKCSDPMAVDPSLVRSSPVDTGSSSTTPKPKKLEGICIPCLLGAASGTFVTFLIVQVTIGLYVYRRRYELWKRLTSAHKHSNSKGLTIFSSAEIIDFTGNFKHQIGPKMYKGMLPNRQPVAIKDLEASLEERKFRGAVLRLGSIHHRNLLKLEGYCCESIHRYLVYEYAKNGSLEKYIDDPEQSKKLTWRRRTEICISVARAICYLHTGCREFFSHGNLKCSNVVLDESFMAKVTEFGLHKVQRNPSSCETSGSKDIEDLGKLAMILVSGCLDVDSVKDLAYGEWMAGRAASVVDKRIEDKVDLEEVERVLRISFWCLQSDERLRPSIMEVVKVLEGTLDVDPPPHPFSCQKSLEEEETSQPGSEP